jgi:hypothetical protein
MNIALFMGDIIFWRNRMNISPIVTATAGKEKKSKTTSQIKEQPVITGAPISNQNATELSKKIREPKRYPAQPVLEGIREPKRYPAQPVLDGIREPKRYPAQPVLEGIREPKRYPAEQVNPTVSPISATTNGGSIVVVANEEKINNLKRYPVQKSDFTPYTTTGATYAIATGLIEERIDGDSKSKKIGGSLNIDS